MVLVNSIGRSNSSGRDGGIRNSTDLWHAGLGLT